MNANREKIDKELGTIDSDSDFTQKICLDKK